MTSISGASLPPVAWDRSKPVKLPDGFYQPEPADSAYSRFLQAESSGAPLTPDNRPDNIWGKISLPNGDIATIYNKGSVETTRTTLDIDWTIEGEAARAEAIIAMYGGTLEIVDTADPNAPKVAPSDASTLLSTILDSPLLAERMLGVPDRPLPEDLMLQAE